MNGIPFSQRLQNNQDNCNTVRDSMPNFHSGSAQNVFQVLFGSPPCCEVSERAHFLPASPPAASSPSEAKLGNCRRTVAAAAATGITFLPSLFLLPRTVALSHLARVWAFLPPLLLEQQYGSCVRVRASAQCEMVVPLNERAMPHAILPLLLSGEKSSIRGTQLIGRMRGDSCVT